MDNKQFSILLVSALFMAFLGAFLGTLICFKEMMPQELKQRHFLQYMQEPVGPPPAYNHFEGKMPSVEKMMEEQENFVDRAEDNFEDMMEHPPTPARLVLISNSGIKTSETKNAFKVIVDLKPFNNDEKNIKMHTHSDKIFISAEYKSGQNGDFKSAQLHQMLTFPVKIDAAKITKQKQGNVLVITVPKKD